MKFDRTTMMLAVGAVAVWGVFFAIKPRPPSEHRVVYTVRSDFYGADGEASLTMSNEQGGTEQRKVKLPYTSGPMTMGRGQLPYISAQNERLGDINCEIIVDGKSAATSTSEGQFAIATCSTSLARR